jgi:hypothetical protein
MLDLSDIIAITNNTRDDHYRLTINAGNLERHDRFQQHQVSNRILPTLLFQVINAAKPLK